METLNRPKSSTKTIPEYRIAASICVKIKDAAKVLPSNDPFHKNGVKFSIAKPVYHYIVEEELRKNNLIRSSENKVKEFLTQLLTQLN